MLCILSATWVIHMLFVAHNLTFWASVQHAVSRDVSL